MKSLRLLGVAIMGLAIVSMACSLPVVVIGDREIVRGNGDVVEATENVQDFSHLVFAGSGDLFIEQGFEESLRMEVEENLIDYMDINVRGDTLTIGIKEGVNLRPTEPMLFYLDVKDLESITLAGSGFVEVPEFQAEKLNLTLSGSGNIIIDYLEALSLVAKITGSGNIEISGELEDQDVSIVGSGDYDARGLESAIADVVISGSGTAEIRVEEKLDVLISGSGNVRYYGSPRIDQTITGSGDVDKMGD